MKYTPFGKCIYCGSQSEELSAEHVVPVGLDGNIILPDSSCVSCQRTINENVEQPFLRRILLSPRTHWKSKTRRPKKRSKTLRVGVGTPGKDFKWKDVPIPEHPLAFGLPIFPPPGFMRGAKPCRNFEILGFWGYSSADFHERAQRHGKKTGIYQPFSPDIFCRMIAKIAHAYAAADIGIDNFTPFLPGVILGHSEIISHYVGASPSPPPSAPPKGALTEVSHGLELEFVAPVPGPVYVIATIHLFKTLNTPAYLVVVGQLPQESAEQLVLEKKILDTGTVE